MKSGMHYRILKNENDQCVKLLLVLFLCVFE